MGKVILGVTISLDGFAEDSNGSVGALYPDLDTLRNTEVLRESIDTTGSVVMSWKEFAMAEDPDSYAGNYEYQVPIFVFTDKAPKKHPKETDRLTFTFVTDGIKSAVRQAKAAAGDKNVTIIGSASTTAQCIRAGLADELHIDIMPVFLKAGFRPFEDIGNKSIKMERIKAVELPAGRTHLRFRVVKSNLPPEKLMSKNSTRVSRYVNAPRARVYRALLDARAVAKWGGADRHDQSRA